jgi:hypothetical protein
LSIFDKLDAVDALAANVAWQEMVAEKRSQQDSLVRAMVAEGTSPAERERMATEYRMIEGFILWPDQYRRSLEDMQE